MQPKPLSKSEAQAALDEISSVISTTQKAIASGPAAPLLIMWGVIWVIGYSVTQFSPQHAGLAWMGLVFAGSAASWWVGWKMQATVSSPNDWKIGVFWMVLFGYAIVWMFLLAPADLPKGEEWATKHPFLSKQIGAFFATIPMFAYVVGGLWFGSFFVWLGLIVTALTLGGYYFLEDYFSLWMALTGGGSLILAGLYVRKFWR